jgi:chemotaxis protein methyltransferase CheR
MLQSIFVNNLRKIFFECCSDTFCKEMSRLEAELASCQHENVEITFSKVKKIPIHVIDKLLAIKNLQILTDDRSLWLYLGSLKFNIKILSIKLLGVQNQKQIRAICIGGSAGSLDTILEIIKNIPYIDISIFITIHVLPNSKNDLVAIIGNITKFTVKEASNFLTIEPNHIYIAPPDNHLVVADGVISVSHDDYVNFARPSIDVMFKSVSDHFKESAMAILCCGYGNDGSAFLGDLTTNGTRIIIENPNNCVAKDMLRNAISTGYYDKILNVEEIKSYLHDNLKTFVFENDEIKYFIEQIYKNFGFDFRHYEINFLKRRINLVKGSYGLSSLSQMMELSFSNMAIMNDLIQNFLINVTSFFRNPEVFGELKVIIQEKFQDSKFIRIWCAGCSSGQEVYSLAMLMDDLDLLDKTQIYATDYDMNILMEARNAIYSKVSFEQCKKNFKTLNFAHTIDNWVDEYQNFVKINEKLTKKVLFFDHNLVTDASINEFDIIFCRNVMIYFDKKLQRRVFDLLYESMSDDAILVLGESENPAQSNRFKKISNIKKAKVFQKNNS